MITAAPPSDIETLDQLVERLGSIPLERIRLRPAPGTATEADLLAEDAAGRRLCELVEGVLVEKAVGFLESRLAIILAHLIESYLDQNRIGIVSGADGPIRLIVGLVRMPDVAFISRSRLPGGQIPRDAIANVIPDLAVEVISRKNTAAEMRRKIREYFEAGVRLVWLVDGVKKTVRCHTAVDTHVDLTEHDELPVLDILPGFRLTLNQWLKRAELPPM